MTKHQLYIGDAKQVLALIPASSVDLIITGPPYWNEVVYSDQPGQLSAISGYPTFLEEIGQIWQQSGQALKPGGILAFWVHDLYRQNGPAETGLSYIALHADLVKTLPDNFTLRQISVWDRYLSRVRDYIPLKEGAKYQYIIIAQKKGAHPSNQALILKSLREEFWKPVWKFKTTPKLLGSRLLFKLAFKMLEPFSDKIGALKEKSKKLLKDEYRFVRYKTTCPPEVAQRLIEKFSQTGDTILDPFLGSGTTMRVADELNRKCIGLEINPETISVVLDKVGQDKVDLIYNDPTTPSHSGSANLL